MNEINVDVLFKSNYAEIKGFKTWPKAVSGDYNSTKMVFNFDREDGTKVLEIKNPLTDEVVYKDTIRNNESVLVGYTEVLDENNYVKYTDNEENIYWYDKEHNVVYDSEYQESQVEIETLIKVKGEAATIFANEGDYICEISLYGNDSKLSVLSFILPVGAESIKDDDTEAIIYKPVFDSLINTVNGKIEEIDEALIDVNNAIDDVNDAIEEVNNLDLDVNKVEKETTVELTKKDGTTKEVKIYDGVSLQFMWQGTSLGVKTDDMQDYVFVNLQGVQGVPGPQGEPFRIKKTYSSVAEMNADFNNMNYGDYVMIASTVEVEDNAKLYTRGEFQWIFITDFSGATGIRGETGLTPNIHIGTVVSGDTPSVTRTGTNEDPILNFVLKPGEKGETGETGATGATGNGVQSITKTGTNVLVDTYTITYTNGTTTTFEITNGEDGEVTQEQYDELEDRVLDLERNQKKGSATGTEIDLTDAFDTRPRYLGIDATETKQVTTTGKNLLGLVDGTYSNNGITAVVNRGEITLNGTASATSFVNIPILENIELVNKTVTLSLNNPIAGGDNLTEFRLNTNNVSYMPIKINSVNNNATFTNKTDTYIVVVVRTSSGINYTNFKLKPMLEEGSTATEYEPYTGGNPSPSPDYPQDVETMVGYRNLWEFESTYTSSGYATILNQQEYRLNKGNYILSFKNVIVSSSILFRFFNQDKSTYYDARVTVSNKTPILNALEDIYYVSLIFNEANSLENIQITEGSEQLPYVPYGGSNYMALDDVGKNIWDGTYLNAIVGTDGKFNNNDSTRTAMMKIEPNKTYTIKKFNNTGLGTRFTIVESTKKLNSGEIGTFIYNNNNATEYTYISGANAYYLYIYVTGDINNIPNLMVTLGNIVPTSYEPYQHKQYPISLGNQELLNKNDYVDKIIVDESTGQRYIDKVWGKVVLDGISKKANDIYNYSNMKGVVINNVLRENLNRANGICTHSQKVGSYFSSNAIWCGVGTNHLFWIGILDILGFTTIEEFNNWLIAQNNANTPVEIYYQLATPQIIPIDNPNIKLLNGVNHITNSEGAEMDIVYVKDINTYLENELSNIKNAIVSLGGDI